MARFSCSENSGLREPLLFTPGGSDFLVCFTSQYLEHVKYSWFIVSSCFLSSDISSFLLQDLPSGFFGGQFTILQKKRGDEH